MSGVAVEAEGARGSSIGGKGAERMQRRDRQEVQRRVDATPQGGRGEVAPAISSALHTRAIVSTDRNTPLVKKRVQAMPPCSDEVYERVNMRICRGELWGDAAKAEGVCWTEWREAGQLPHNVERYRAVMAARDEAHAADIAYTGEVLLRTARAELPASEEEDTDAAGGVRRKKSLQRAASTAQAGAALLMPSIHGRGAGRQAPIQITANNAAFFGGAAPVGSLDDFAPEGLSE